MTGAVGTLLLAVLIPLFVGEVRDLAPSIAAWLLRWGASRVGQPDLAERYEEEWLADLEQVPGKATKLAHACFVVALSVPRLRAQYRSSPRGALLSGWIVEMAAEELAMVPEAGAALQRVAQVLVPRFADHCIVDLFQDGVLIRQVQRNADGWTPPPGTWARVGEQIRYPEGHFCDRAMGCMDTVLIPDLAEAGAWASSPPPSAQSLVAAQQVGMKSVIAAPLHARGMLLGVISIALSDLTGRSERFNAGDQDVIGAVACRVSAALDTSATWTR
jgi:hypothetical protein